MGVYSKNVEASPEAMKNYAMVSMMLISLQQVRSRSDAAVLYYPGLFDTDMRGNLEKWAADLFNAGHQYRHVLVAGHHAEGGQQAHLELPVLESMFGVAGDNYSQVKAAHTGEQALWTADIIRKLELKVVYLYAPAFHLPRAYLTTLKAFMKADIHWNVLLLPRALPINPIEELPMTPPYEDGRYNQYELVGGEANKLLAYTADVATLAELEEYLAHHL